MDSGTRDFTSLLNRRCTRKEQRKTNKKLKTACRVAFCKHQNIDAVVKDRFIDKAAKKKDKRKRQAERRRQSKLEKEDEPEDLETFLKEAEEVRRQRMREHLDEDELEIQRLERKIAAYESRKRKNKEKQVKHSDLDDDD